MVAAEEQCQRVCIAVVSKTAASHIGQAAVEQQHGSSISDPGSVGGRPGSLSVAPWGGDAAASLEMVKETGWLPGTFGGQLEAMRYETEHGGEAKTYVFGSELLEQHHADLLKGMKVPRQFDGVL